MILDELLSLTLYILVISFRCSSLSLTNFHPHPFDETIFDHMHVVTLLCIYCIAGNFTCVQVMFTLKRRLGYFIFHTYVPTCLIVVMSWISFWIKPDAVPARVTLCVTSLLTLSTQHAQSQKSLPPVSYIKAIDIFMSSCTVFVFASLMEYALVNIFMTADEKINLRSQQAQHYSINTPSGHTFLVSGTHTQQQQPQQSQASIAHHGAANANVTSSSRGTSVAIARSTNSSSATHLKVSWY